MALSDIRTQVRIEIGGRQDMDSVIDDQINYALQEFCTMYEFEELQGNATTTTTSGQHTYLLPSDLYVLWYVKEETQNNRQLERKDYNSFHQRDETELGTPSSYAVYAKQLLLFDQVPDDNGGSNYSIRILYWKNHAKLVVDGDAPVTPLEWERGIRMKATAFMFNILDMDEKAAAKQQELDRWLSRIKIPKAAGIEKAKTARLNFGAGWNR
jgi:hypothetical protein